MRVRRTSRVGSREQRGEDIEGRVRGKRRKILKELEIR
jgi:hypothetical protein